MNTENNDLAESPVAEAPSEVLAEAPSEVLAEAPSEVLAEAPSEVLAEAPSEAPSEAPAEVLAEAPADGREVLVQEYNAIRAKLEACRKECDAAYSEARDRLGVAELEAAHEALWTKMYNLRAGELGERAAAIEAARERLREAREQLSAMTLANSRAKMSLAESRARCLRARQSAKASPDDESLKAAWKNLATNLAKEEKSRKDIRRMLKSAKITAENASEEYRSLKTPYIVAPANLLSKG